MTNHDVTSKVLSKVFSLEFLLLLVGTGIAWGSLVATVSTLDNKIASHSEKHNIELGIIRREAKDAHSERVVVGNKLIEIEINQKHLVKEAEALGETQKEILNILRKEYQL